MCSGYGGGTSPATGRTDNRYDPNPMPPDLRRAHRALDRAVDRLYRRKGFATERERVEHLFMLYEKMRAPLEAGMKGKKRRWAARSATVGPRR